MVAFAAVCALGSVLVAGCDGGLAAGCCVWAEAAGGFVFGVDGLLFAVLRWFLRPVVPGAGFAGVVVSGGFSVGVAVPVPPVGSAEVGGAGSVGGGAVVCGAGVTVGAWACGGGTCGFFFLQPALTSRQPTSATTQRYRSAL